MIKPRITLLTSGPSRGLWRCESENPEHHPGAFSGKTPSMPTKVGGVASVCQDGAFCFSWSSRMKKLDG